MRFGSRVWQTQSEWFGDDQGNRNVTLLAQEVWSKLGRGNFGRGEITNIAYDMRVKPIDVTQDVVWNWVDRNFKRARRFVEGWRAWFTN